MAISQGVCDSFSQELLLGTHAFGTDTYKMALYTEAASIGPSTTVYTATGEVSGIGYSAGGVVVTGVTVTRSGSESWINFDNPEWTNASFSSRGALLYNSSKSNKAVLVLDFGDTKTFTGTFQVTLPAGAPSSALLRVKPKSE